jgi:hypothetical protein
MGAQMKKIISKVIILFNLLFCNYMYGTAVLSIENDTNLTTDDLIELSIVVDDMNDNTLDLSPLKSDFEIINQTQQVYHSIINGKTSSKIQWLISVQAKTAGVLTIPSIKAGNQTTNNLQVNIKTPNYDPNKAKEIFINIETNNQELYIQTPLSILVNIYVSTNITARNLQLDMPKNDHYKLYKISEDNKQTFYKNNRYHLYQVKYLAFYDSPGKFKLPKFNLSGLILKNNTQHNDIFSLYQQQWQPFNRSTHELEVNIIDKPASFANMDWLAADNITIHQTWSNNTNSIKTGDALQRIITITGQNIPAEFLPTIEEPDATTEHNNYKMYVDKPEFNNNVDNNILTGSLTQKITYIPTQSGTLNLPNKTIHWWHNKTKSKIDSTIDGKNFDIVNVTGQPHSNTTALTGTENNAHNMALTNQTEAMNNNNNQNPNENLSNITNNLARITDYSINKLFYMFLGVIILLTTIILILILKLNQYKQIIKDKLNNSNYVQSNSHDNAHIKQLKSELDQQIKILKTHAINQDASLVYKSICTIAELLYPHHYNSSLTLKAQLSQACQQTFEQLLEVIYSSKKITWDNIEFINNVIPAIEQQTNILIKKQVNIHKNHQNYGLPELYPK